jgi:hypothetical protein
VDTELLVEQKDDGERLIEQLARDKFATSVAFWLKTSDEGSWQLYIASPLVEEAKANEAYRKVYSSLGKAGASWVSPSDIRLLNDSSPLARNTIDVRDRHPGKMPTTYHGKRLGGLSISEAYIYPEKPCLRQSFTARYYKKGQSNEWRSTIKREEMRRDVQAKGAVAYTTARREGETAADENFAIVGVFLQLDPRFDNDDLIVSPGVWQTLTEQAWQMADEMFKNQHPEAIIEHHRNGDE